MKRIITCLCLSVLAFALSSCYSPSPQFAITPGAFQSGFHGGDTRYDPPASRWGTESLEAFAARGSSGGLSTEYSADHIQHHP